MVDFCSPSSDSACVTRISTLTPVHTGDDFFEMGCAADLRQTHSPTPPIRSYLTTWLHFWDFLSLLLSAPPTSFETRSHVLTVLVFSAVGVVTCRRDRYALPSHSPCLPYDTVIEHTRCTSHAVCTNPRALAVSTDVARERRGHTYHVTICALKLVRN